MSQQTPPAVSPPAAVVAAIKDSPLIAAATGRRAETVPVWFMRQAGRSLPEYRKLREGVDMMTACTSTELIAEITLQPVRRHDVDAAILFSDIVLPLRLAGVDVDIKPGVGPVVAQPFRTESDVDRIGRLGDTSEIEGAIGQITTELGSRPLIGFCGAPFTLASYLVEGGPSRDHAQTKAMMWSRPELWSELCSRIAEVGAEYLKRQIAAGAAAVQVFDSWAGALNRADYEANALPFTRRILAQVVGVPRINFGTGTAELLSSMAVSECEVVGVDHRVDLADAIERIGPHHAVQGNLDPATLWADEDTRIAMANRIVAAGRLAPGHIFNLGHGVLPDTDPRVITDLVRHLHSL